MTEKTSEFKRIILKEKKIINELKSFHSSLHSKDFREKEVIYSQIKSLIDSLREANNQLPYSLNKMFIARPIYKEDTLDPSPENNVPLSDSKVVEDKTIPGKKGIFKSLFGNESFEKEINLSSLEKQTLKRLRNKKKIIENKKTKKPSKYVATANRLFFETSSKLSEKEFFRTLERDLVKSHLEFVPASYISTIIFTTLISFFVSIFVMVFFMFFNFGVKFPMITPSLDDPLVRFLKVFWVLFAIPIVTFLFGYTYPSMERKSLENKINQELPFAAIHMFAISGSMIDPSRIFSVIISTKEYIAIEKEFIRLINEITIYGYDLVNALKSTAMNTPSKKLSELLNGFATTITSGGDLKEFFDKRSQTLLFDYRLEREKYTKSAETFMDIYISVVIAAPMILMLLVILIKISGLGLSLSTSIITLMMILGVSLINVLFLVFLYLKQPSV